jgi:murein DD-endopeptidase MepM/ murein hydrolase activator NlpD
MTTPPPLRLSTLVLALVTGLTSITAPVLVGTGSAPSATVRAAGLARTASPARAGPGGTAAGSASPARPAAPRPADPRAGPPGSTPADPPASPVSPVSPQDAADPPSAAGRFGWPLAPPHPVVRPFEAPSSPYGPGHRGVDIGGVAGEAVLAAGAGVVVFAGQLAGRGVVSVDHPNGLRTTYEPVAPVVKAGRRVAPGAMLGHLRTGHPGCPGVCLHWGVRRGAEYLDPLALVATGHVRLLPWEEVG